MPAIGSATALRPPDAYLAVAGSWPLAISLRDTEPGHLFVEAFHLEREGKPVRQVQLDCGECGQSVYCLVPDIEQDLSYAVDADTLAARVLAHLKVSHDDALPRT